ncbi:hypothetical protein KP509_15G056300 [Ceratopteris richardii]|nr:hypothetical protein KP509_15G056300 [Ceratopteris richardii]
MPNSPPARMGSPRSASPLPVLRSGGSTPHHSGLLRTSKGHAVHPFTMMPPDVVGRKKPPDYESDEPTSPEVTCIGKVRRKHCKATWDALVKDKERDERKKKEKVRRLSRKMSHSSEEVTQKQVDFKTEGMDFEPSFRSNSLTQTWEALRATNSRDISEDKGLCVSKNENSRRNSGRGMMHSKDKNGLTSSSELIAHDSCSKSGTKKVNLHDQGPLQPESDTGLSEVGSKEASAIADVPPPNCLLLMKKGSTNRSAHCGSNPEFISEHEHERFDWKWGQVLP